MEKLNVLKNDLEKKLKELKKEWKENDNLLKIYTKAPGYTASDLIPLYQTKYFIVGQMKAIENTLRYL